MRKILVPVDGSEQSCSAARWAAASGDAVTLLHVYVLDGETTMSLGSRSADEIKDIREKHAAPVFDKARAAMGGVKPSNTIAVMGNAGEEIVSQAKLGGFDQVVMGNRGRSAIKELLLGSVSEHVLHHAHCPVTIVR